METVPRGFWIALMAGAFLLSPVPDPLDEPAALAQTKKKKKKRRRRAKKRRVEKAPPPPPVEKKESDLVPAATLRGPTRLDFDDRLIQGQTNKSGAVYLFDRKETGISSMVRRRKSFRQLTIRTIYDR